MSGCHGVLCAILYVMADRHAPVPDATSHHGISYSVSERCDCISVASVARSVHVICLRAEEGLEAYAGAMQHVATAAHRSIWLFIFYVK